MTFTEPAPCAKLASPMLSRTSCMQPAILIERDGILNRVRPAQPFPRGPVTFEELELNTESVEPLTRLKQAGFLLIGTTNQPGLSNGALSRWELDRMHQVIRRHFFLDDILVCPHSVEDRCPCRKPLPGLISEAVFRWRLQLNRTYVISDKWLDAAAAQYAGCVSLLIVSPWSVTGHHDYLLPNLQAVVDKVLHMEGRTLGDGLGARISRLARNQLAKAATF
jgi:D-glycero-D-manno-heptose 1,7-bisphosphate phosphatase